MTDRDSYRRAPSEPNSGLLRRKLGNILLAGGLAWAAVSGARPVRASIISEDPGRTASDSIMDAYQDPEEELSDLEEGAVQVFEGEEFSGLPKLAAPTGRAQTRITLRKFKKNPERTDRRDRPDGSLVYHRPVPAGEGIKAQPGDIVLGPAPGREFSIRVFATAPRVFTGHSSNDPDGSVRFFIRKQDPNEALLEFNGTCIDGGMPLVVTKKGDVPLPVKLICGKQRKVNLYIPELETSFIQDAWSNVVSKDRVKPNRAARRAQVYGR